MSESASPDGRGRGRRRRRAGAWLFVLTLSAAAAPPAARAQTSMFALPANPDSALQRELAAMEGAPLSLPEAVQAGIAGAASVREAAAELRAAQGAARRERGAFDPELFADALRIEEDQPSASFFAGADVVELKQTTASGGARVRLPLGTELSASLDAVRTETNSAFSALRPQYDAAGRIAVRQPLLRGFGPGTWGERSAANRELEAARARYEDVVSATRTDVEQAYWDLYAAERDLAVARLIREQASALVRQAGSRRRAGLIGPNQVASAEVFLAEQDQAVIDREEALDRISDRIASLMGSRPPEGAVRFRPTGEPPRDFPVESQDELVRRALAENLEIRALRREVDAARARESRARWNAYPSLDLVGSLGGTGLSGTPQDVVFGGDTLRTSVRGDMGDAIADVRRREFPAWSAGVSLTLPIFLREGRGERDRLRAEAEAARARLTAAERDLEERVRAEQRELSNAARRLEAAERGVAASFEQVRISVIEFNYGRATAFELSRLGADLAAAQQRYSQALVRTAKAAAELRHLTSGGVPPIRNEGDESR